MKHWTTSLTLITTLALGTTSLTSHADEAEAPAAEAVAEAKASMTGKLVLPEELPGDMKADAIDLSKLTGSIVWEVPQVEPPFPDGFEEMSDEDKQAWVQEFRQSPEFQEYMQKARARMAEQRAQTPMDVTFGEDGSFKVDGLKPGTYLLRASIPHPRSDKHMLAQFGDRIEVKAGETELAAGNKELTINTIVLPGDMAPDFTAQNLAGGEFKLSDFRGKYVLIDFWATWCGPCIAEMPNLKAVYKDFAGPNFEMIALSLDQTIDLPKDFIKKNPADYVQGYLGNWSDTEVPRQYGVRGIPSIWLIGPDGKIVARDLRGQRLRDEVAKAVAQGKNAS